MATISILELHAEFPTLADKYPHVLDKARMFWGEQEFYTFIESLFIQDRSRMGFTMEAFREIRALERKHEQMHPKYVPEDVWHNRR